MLIEDQHGVRIEGESSKRERVAYANEINGRLVYALEGGTGTMLLRPPEVGPKTEDRA